MTTAGLVLVTAVLATPIACSSDSVDTAWERDVLSARRLQDEGEYEKAERRYRQLMEGADTREERRYVRIQLARLAADRGDTKAAVDEYRSIWSKNVDDSTGAKAMFEHAVLIRDRLEEPNRAREFFRRLVLRYPRSMWAERSLEELAEAHARDSDWEGLEESLLGLYRRARGTEVADDILYTLGETFEKDAGDDDTALGYYAKTMRRHPDANFADDAEWRAAQILVARQNWEPAVALLERLANRVQTSWWIGTYNSPFASQARFKLGMIHLTHLSKYRRAIAHFRRYIDDFPRNARADDSAWHIAHAHRLRGDENAFRRALRDLIETFPKSRYVDSARRILGGTG